MVRNIVPKLLVAAALASLIVGPAWSSPADRRAEQTVRFEHSTMVNRTEVPAGEYLLVVKGDRLKVENMSDHRVMAESPITWKHVSRPVLRKLDVDRGVLTKVNFRDMHESVILHNS
ncbi:MAG TPA: hypothetical protein VFO34_02520 [Candidatus Acidoferrales bacterium]|nr:hypothetical protein [Candidatus Acidoferrales bacterium]